MSRRCLRLKSKLVHSYSLTIVKLEILKKVKILKVAFGVCFALTSSKDLLLLFTYSMSCLKIYNFSVN